VLPVGGNLKMVTDRPISVRLEIELKRLKRNFAMTVIELSDDDAAVLQAKAARRGLTLQAWMKKMAEEETEDQGGSSDPFTLQTAADIILEEMRKIPADIMARMPKDGASQHDHYLYGAPKKEA